MSLSFGSVFQICKYKVCLANACSKYRMLIRELFSWLICQAWIFVQSIWVFVVLIWVAADKMRICEVSQQEHKFQLTTKERINSVDYVCQNNVIVVAVEVINIINISYIFIVSTF